MMVVCSRSGGKRPKGSPFELLASFITPSRTDSLAQEMIHDVCSFACMEELEVDRIWSMAKGHRRGLWGEIVGPSFAPSIFFAFPFGLKNRKPHVEGGKMQFCDGPMASCQARTVSVQ